MTCCGVRLPAGRSHCAFCRRTIRLIREGLCVSCTEPVESYSTHVYGLCASCLSSRVRVGPASRRLLILAAKARHAPKRRAA